MVAISCAGCNKDAFRLAPVSGTVTLDGQPVANIEVMFTPTANESTSNTGPFSRAVTDSSGNFTLKSKQGDPGAVIGQHSVSCQYNDFDPDAESNLMEQIQEAKASGGDTSAARAKLASVKNQKRIPDRYADIKVTVGKEGLTGHTIELTSK